MAHAKFGRIKIKLPGSVAARRTLGGALCAGGVLGFLPVLGFWMLPLGVVVLSADSHPVRRLRRRAEVKVEAWRRRRRAMGQPEKKGGPE
jgi:hypothetical protein